MDKLDCVVVGVALIDNSNKLVRLTPNEEGFLGVIEPGTAESVAAVANKQIDTGMKVRLIVSVNDGAEKDVFGCTVDNKKNVTLKPNLFMRPNPALSDDENQKAVAQKRRLLGNKTAYGLDIHLKWSDEDKCLYTEYPANHLRLLHVVGKTVEEWEFSVTSQGGKFFLSQQKVYSWIIFKHGGNVASFDEGLMNWPQMCEVLKTLISENLNNLPEFTDELGIDLEDIDPTKVEKFEENKHGRVKWWNYSKGLGAVVTTNGLARVHWSQVAPYPEMRYLVPGGMVQFKALKTPETKPGRPTKFKYEAVEVENI